MRLGLPGRRSILKAAVRLCVLLLLGTSSCINKSCEERLGPRAVAGTRENRILSPFPTDRLTVPDPATPTGLRVDLPPPENGNALENELVRMSNGLDGFGTFAPICVRFDQPLDANTVTPDTCFLVDVADGSRVGLDIDQGYYPMKLGRPVRFYPIEPQYPDLIYPPPNRAAYYEDATDSLVLRPCEPLKPATRYLVLLTRRIRGLNGEPIEPPPNEPPTAQEFDDFARVAGRLGLAPLDVGFYWTFTTQSVTRELEVIRSGLDAQGPLAWLPERFPARVGEILDLQRGLLDGNPYTLEAWIVAGLFRLLYLLAQVVSPVYPELESGIRPFVTFFADMDNVDYFAFGSLASPSFVGTPDGVFSIDAQAGTASVSRDRVPFMLAVPKPSAENNYARAPYPVVVMGHGLGASSIMAMPLANRMAAQGLASACIDLVGHGPLEQLWAIPKAIRSLDEPWATLARPVLAAIAALVGTAVSPFAPMEELVEGVFGGGVLRPLFWEGRSVDIDGDGEIDPTKGFFRPNFFRIRDNLRQCAVDQMQFVRALRNLGSDANGNGTLDPEEGDINRDGVLDFGGPANPLSYMGVSLGGILGGIVMGVEPHIGTGVLNVGGGGLADVMMRTSELRASFVQHVTREMFGLNVVARPDGGQLAFTFNNAPLDSAFWRAPAADVVAVRVRNLAKDLTELAVPRDDGGMAATILTDAGDELEVVLLTSAGEGARTTVRAPYSGLGLRRGTSRMREYFMLLAWILEPADPVSYAPCWWRRPMEGMPEKNVLVQVSCADPTVCVSTSVALARAAGLLSPERMAELAQMGVVRGANVPVDPVLPVESTQYRALRFHTAGRHAYIIGDNRNDLETSVEYALRTQDQVAIFCATQGAVVMEYPVFKKVIPDD